MNRLTAAFALATAFAAGCGATHFLRPALAAENLTAQVIHTGELEGDAIRRSTRAACATRCSVWPTE